MLANKEIIISIAEHGAVITIFHGQKTLEKLFIDLLDETSQNHIKNIFKKFSAAPIYIILDNHDQSYRKKNYPLLKKGDLKQVIKRDLASDIDKESIKNYIILDQNSDTKSKERKQWEVLFVSCPLSENTHQWLKFLLEFPNEIKGIYMAAIEMQLLFKNLEKNINLKSKIASKKNQVYCLILRNKISQIRQVVFSKHGMIFTRTIDYDFTKASDLEKYEHDIYSTFEYLKRLYSDLKMSEFEVVNILSEKELEKINKINNVELNFINYTPNQVAKELGYFDLLPNNSAFCDLLISRSFYEAKKKQLKFSTKKIDFFHKFFLAINSLHYANLILIALVSLFCVMVVYEKEKHSKAIETIENKKLTTLQELAKLNKFSLNQGKNQQEVSIERIVDFGKNEELFGKIEDKFLEFYDELAFVKNHNVILKSASYQLKIPNPKILTNLENYEIKFSGEIKNKSGDIEDLFRNFDNLNAQVKKNYVNMKIDYNELPKNIDFNKKYYSFPIDFTIRK
jgi:hypothetical protein